MIALGRLSLTLALVFSLASVVFLAVGVRRDRKDFLRNGYYAVYAFFFTTLVASAVLLSAFLRKDFRFGYVFENSDASLSTFYRVAGFWAGQQGSFLLWTCMIAVVVVIIALRDLGRLERLTAAAVMTLAAVGAVFTALMVFDHTSDPFVKATAGGTPFGLNPLLLHPAMVLHPPALFAGYVGLSVPFAFAVGALLLGRADRLWVQRAQKWALGGWLFLSLGIGLGAWWAYVVLSFGGYWGWDPVENTSLVPWLTATALLHAMTLYRTRRLFKRWALSLAAVTFFFTILATWTTRTGLIDSVHAFEKNQILIDDLTTFLVITVAASIGLIVWRWRRFASHEELESLLSREFLYYVTNLLLTVFAVAVAFETVAIPLLAKGFSFKLFHLIPISLPAFSSLPDSVGASTYRLVAQPLGVLTLALIAICPLLAWRKTEGAALRKMLILPTATMLLSVPLWLYLGFQSNVLGFIGLLVCGFAFGAVIEFVLRAARRAAGPGKSLWSGLGRAFTGSRTRTAAYVVHLGMVLIVAGLLGSNVYKTTVTSLVTTKPGATAEVGDYTLVYRGLRQSTGPQSSRQNIATFDVRRGGQTIGMLEPHTDVYPVAGAAVRAVILGGWKQDLFVTPDDAFTKTSKTIALRMVIFPLVRFVWLGSILLVAGAAVSLWPRRRRQEQEVRATAVDDSDAVPNDAAA